MKKNYGKILLFTLPIVAIILLFASTIYYYNQYTTYKEAEQVQHRLNVNTALFNVMAASERAKADLKAWDELSDARLVGEAEKLQALLSNAETAFSLTGKHYELAAKDEARDVSFIAGLFEAYNDVLHTWEIDLVNENSSVPSELRREALKIHFSVLAEDLEVLRGIDAEKLSKYSYEETEAYWRDLVSQKLKHQDVVGLYKNKYGYLFVE